MLSVFPSDHPSERKKKESGLFLVVVQARYIQYIAEGHYTTSLIFSRRERKRKRSGKGFSGLFLGINERDLKKTWDALGWNGFSPHLSTI